MHLRVEIQMDNAAFEGDAWTIEAARILRKAADKLEGGETNDSLRDINGNKVGSVWVVGLERHLVGL